MRSKRNSSVCRLRKSSQASKGPSTAPPAGDWIGLIQGYIKDGGLVLGLAIAVLGFLWIAYLGFAKFNEARQGKAEWAEVGVLGIVGAIVLIFASYLLTEAAGVI